MTNDEETYLLLLLSDSNLPTGNFVASSGLESYIKHGFSSSSREATTIAFLQDSVATYARSSLPFVSDAHRIVQDYGSCSRVSTVDESYESTVIKDLMGLDDLYHAMTLNHVARRASEAQGIALLTLYNKSFSRPSSLQLQAVGDSVQQAWMSSLLDAFKLTCRREESHGHIPICWGILTAALGLTLERSQYLYLFLHARSILSASVRLNEIGPYGSQQVLLHVVKPLIDEHMARCKDLRSGYGRPSDFDEMEYGPANTWPLGDILSTRHDLQHSRIFNS